MEQKKNGKIMKKRFRMLNFVAYNLGLKLDAWGLHVP